MSRLRSEMPPAIRREIIRRIKAAMDKQGSNPTEVSRKSRLGQTAVYDIIAGRNKNPSVPILKKISDTLSLNFSDLWGDAGGGSGPTEFYPAKGIPVSGVAEAGAFREMSTFPIETEAKMPHIIAPRSAKHPKARHFSFLVRGDSMNAATPTPILDGMYVLCVDIADAGLVVETGHIYLVRRTLDAGATFEWTVKRAFVFRDRVELRPESTNPKHKIFVLPRDDLDNSHEITAIGLVYGAYGAFE